MLNAARSSTRWTPTCWRLTGRRRKRQKHRLATAREPRRGRGARGSVLLGAASPRGVDASARGRGAARSARRLPAFSRSIRSRLRSLTDRARERTARRRRSSSTKCARQSLFHAVGARPLLARLDRTARRGDRSRDHRAARARVFRRRGVSLDSPSARRADFARRVPHAQLARRYEVLRQAAELRRRRPLDGDPRQISRLAARLAGRTRAATRPRDRFDQSPDAALRIVRRLPRRARLHDRTRRGLRSDPRPAERPGRGRTRREPSLATP